MHMYFPFGMGAIGWGWGWAATAGSIIVLGILLVPMFFFLLNLHNLLERIDPRNRAMAPANVWLNFIPLFNLYWLVYTVMKVRDSVKAEYAMRGWAPDGDFGYSVGMTAAVLAIVSFFFGWIPVINWLMGIALLICWIMYWLKTSELKGRLGQLGMPRAGGSQGYPGGPYVPPVVPPYTTQQPWPGAQQQPQWQPQQQPIYQPPQQQQAPQPPQPPQPQPPQQQPMPPQAQQPAPSTGSATPPVPRGPRPGIGQPEGAQPGVAAGQEGQPGAARTRGGTCAACGTTYGPADAFCRTCGMRLP